VYLVERGITRLQPVRRVALRYKQVAITDRAIATCAAIRI
jgi:hypothetical protein